MITNLEYLIYKCHTVPGICPDAAWIHRLNWEWNDEQYGIEDIQAPEADGGFDVIVEQKRKANLYVNFEEWKKFHGISQPQSQA